MPLEVVPLQREYWEHVVAYTVREARAGRTPNPDVMCNSRIKFGMFYDHVGRHFRHVATGHYARLERDGEDGTPDNQVSVCSHLSVYMNHIESNARRPCPWDVCGLGEGGGGEG